MTHVDVAGLEALRDIMTILAADGIALRVARMKTPVTQRLEDAGIARTIGSEFFHPTVQAAVDASLAATAGTAAASQSPTGIPPATPT